MLGSSLRGAAVVLLALGAATGCLPARPATGAPAPASAPAPPPAPLPVEIAPRRAPGPPPFPEGTPVLRVITLSDFHGALQARPDAAGVLRGGAVALSAAIERARAECTGACRSVVVDGGDLFTGTPASDWDAGRPTVAAVNLLRIDAGALGNHEFDFGQDTLAMRVAELAYPVLGLNVRGPDGERPRWLRADTLIVRDGLRIGLVGAAGTHTATTTKPRNVRDLRFLEPAPLLSERIRALRAAGAQAVVAVIHDGTRCDVERVPMCDGQGLGVVQRLTARPDVFVLAHAHTNEDLRVGGLPVIQVTSNGRAIGVVDVPLDGGTPASHIRPVYGDSVAGADPRLVEVVGAAVARVRPRLERVVAQVAEPLTRSGSQHALGNLMADAARTLGNGEFGAWNNGGMRADIAAGTLTYGAVHELSPFGNVLVRVRLRGEALRALAERFVAGRGPDAHVSGLLVDYDPSAPAGRRVVRLARADGTPLDPSAVVTLVLNDYMLDDPVGGLAGIPTVATELLPIRDIDAMAEWFRRQPQPVRAPREVRIRAVEVTR